MKRRTLCIIGLSVIVLIGCLSHITGSEQTSQDNTLVANQISMQIYGDEDDNTPRKDKAEVHIKALSKVKVGDLIILDLSESLGKGFDYEVEPTPPGLRTFDDGRIIVCGTGHKNVTYTFMVSCALNDDSDIAVHKVKVYGAPETGPIPDPGQNIVEKVKEWASDVKSPSKRDDALRLAQSFASVAVIIEQDTFDSPGELVQATATSNRDALGVNLEHWSQFLDSLMKELKAMAALGQLLDTKSHAPIWKDVAQGLREYSENL